MHAGVLVVWVKKVNTNNKVDFATFKLLSKEEPRVGQ